MRSMVAMFNTGRLSELEATVHPDYQDHQGIDGQELHGQDGFAAVVTIARSGYIDLEVVIEELIDQGSSCSALLRWRGTRPSGEPVERATFEILRTQDERAVEHWGGRPSANALYDDGGGSHE